MTTNFYIQSGSVIQCVSEEQFFHQWARNYPLPYEQQDHDFLLQLDYNEYYLG